MGSEWGCREGNCVNSVSRLVSHDAIEMHCHAMFALTKVILFTSKPGPGIW